MPRSDRVRLFVAADLPDEARTALAAWAVAAVPDPPAPARLRRLAPESLHLTLCFLGGRDRSDVEAIAAACEIARGAGAVETAIGDPLWLPRRRPGVLAVGLSDVAGELAALQARVASALAAGGWHEPEARPFLPHVTVARVRDLRRPFELRVPPALAFTIETVSLYRSHTGPRGARYEPLATVALGG